MNFVQLFILKGKKSQEKSVPKATGDLMTNGCISLQNKEVFVSGVKIFYGSQTGTAKVKTLRDTFSWVFWYKIASKNGIGSSNFFFFNLLFSLFQHTFFLSGVVGGFLSLVPNSSWLVVSDGHCLKLASTWGEWRVLSLLLMVGVEVGDSEKGLLAVGARLGPDFHNFTYLLNTMYSDLIVLRVLIIDIEYCLK